jgi:hypothetical protein
MAWPGSRANERMKSTTCCSNSTFIRLIQSGYRIIFSLAFASATKSFHRLRISHNFERFNNGFHPLGRYKIGTRFIPPGNDNQVVFGSSVT